MNTVSKNTDSFFIRKIQSKVGKVINEYQLISEGDTIVVGLSGGKDSLSLLDILSGRIKYSGSAFQVVAIHVDIVSIPYQVDADYLRQFCEARKIEFKLIKADISNLETDDRNTCYLCSSNRRRVLFEEIRKLGYYKLALGHHKDDAVETLLLNMIFQGSISSLPPKLKLVSHKLEIIRPLITISNDELAEYSLQKGFSTELKNCPFERNSKRNEIRELIQNVKNANPEALNNLFASMSNIQHDYLPW